MIDHDDTSPAAGPPPGGARRRRTIPRPLAMLFIFALPILMMSGLFYAITTYSSMASPMGEAPRVGAGAGRTGMLNEYRTSTPQDQPETEPQDETPATPEARSGSPTEGEPSED